MMWVLVPAARSGRDGDIVGLRRPYEVGRRDALTAVGPETIARMSSQTTCEPARLAAGRASVDDVVDLTVRSPVLSAQEPGKGSIRTGTGKTNNRRKAWSRGIARRAGLSL